MNEEEFTTTEEDDIPTQEDGPGEPDAEDAPSEDGAPSAEEPAGGEEEDPQDEAGAPGGEVDLTDLVTAVVAALPEVIDLFPIYDHLERIEAHLTHSAKASEENFNTHLAGLEHFSEVLDEKHEYLIEKTENVFPLVQNMAQRVDLQQRGLLGLKALFEKKIKENETQKKAFDNLYEDLARYRDDFLGKLQRPLLMSLVRLHDAMVAALDQTAGTAARKVMENLQMELEEILYRQDLEPVTENPQEFDNTIQKAIRRELSPREEDDMRVKSVIRGGWIRGDKVFRPQEVVVLRYDPDATSEEEPPPQKGASDRLMVAEPPEADPVDEDLAKDDTGSEPIGSAADDVENEDLEVEDLSDLQAIVDVASGRRERTAAESRRDEEIRTREMLDQTEAEKTRLRTPMGTPAVDKLSKAASDRLMDIKKRLKDTQSD